MESPLMNDHTETTELPLCVDLDGTLINTDLLMESFFALLRQAPVTVMLWAPFWLAQGTAYLKEQIASRVQIDVTVLPYHTEFLAYLRQIHATGRRLILATASHLRFAEEVAQHLKIFESVLATENGRNLSRGHKGECLVAIYGEHGFDYAGNSRADLAVWPHARAAILVNPVFGLENKARAQVPITEIFDDRQGAWRAYLKSLRLCQWLNNLVIFVPLWLDHRYTEGSALIHTVLTFFTFGLCASSVYIFSDLLNLAIDRQLPHKRHDPFVAGTMSIIHGVVLVPALLGVALLVAIPLPSECLLLLVGYYPLTLVYSLNSKRMMLLDILIRGVLYTMGLIAGYIAIAASISLLFVALSFLLFFGIFLVITLNRSRKSIICS